MEPVELKDPPKRDLPPKDWATTGTKDSNGRKRVINSSILKQKLRTNEP